MCKQNEQVEQQRQDTPVHAAPTTTTTERELTAFLPEEIQAEQIATTTATTTTAVAPQSIQIVQQLRQARQRNAPAVTQQPVVAAAPVQDPYAGMSRVKRHFAKRKEQKRVENNRKKAHQVQMKFAKLWDIEPEKIAPDMPELFQRGQAVQEQVMQQPFDLQQASTMVLDLDCMQEQDYVNEGQTIQIETMLRQEHTLRQIAHIREKRRDIWEALDCGTQARCMTLLDQYEIYHQCVEKKLYLHNLHLDENGKLVQARIGGKAEDHAAIEKSLKLLRARQWLAESDAALYQNMPQRQYTQAEKEAFAEQERAAFRSKNGEETRLEQMPEAAFDALMAQSNSTPQVYRTRVKNWTAAFSQRQKDNNSGLLGPKYRLGAITRDVMIAIGAQEFCDLEQATEEQIEQAFSEGEQLLTALSQLCTLEKGQAVPGVTLDQAVEHAHAVFEICFDRFYRAFEAARADLLTAFTPEGRLLQVQQMSRFYGWWQALKEVYAQSPALQARIPQDQLRYVRSVSRFIFGSKIAIREMLEQQKEDATQLRDRGFNSAEEMQQYDSSSRYEVEMEITAENLTEHNPLRIPVERYAARSGISLDEALHILRETRCDENAAG